MKIERQSKQGPHTGIANRVYFQSPLFLQAVEQFRLFALAVFAVLATALFLATFVQPVSAQDVFGRISGTVTDAQGAVIPDANITITNEQTKLSRTLKTNANGFYVTDDVPVGIYTVGATAQQGFKAFKKTGNNLSAGVRLTVDIKLEVGDTTDVIEVSATGETVNTVSGELARNVDAKQVQSLALNQRNYVQLVSLIPGAALTSFDQQALTTGMSTTASSVNGHRTDGNNFTVDGGFNLDAGSNGTQLNNVGIDFIQEVSVKTSNFSAEYGRNDGASVNVVTRSGGNDYHGGAFEFIRNDVTDAISPGAKLGVIAPGTTIKQLKPPLRFNDFGWNFGGPIIHQKLFFFVGEEWKRIRQGQKPQQLQLPTTAEIAGNFSDVLPASSGGPLAKGGVLLKTPPNAPPGCTITLNVISPQCITPDGAAIAAVYAKMAGVASTFNNAVAINNALFQPGGPQNWREDIVRVDYKPNNAHSLFFRYLHDDLNLIDAFGTFSGPNGNGTNVLPTTPTDRIRPGYGIQGADVWIISPHLINEAKLNVSWNKQRIPPTGTTWLRSTYGFQFPSVFPAGFGGRFPNGIPNVSFTGLGATNPTSGPTQFTGPSFSLLAPTVDISPTDNVTWTLGKHTLKFGVMYARNRKDQNSRPNSPNGVINFAATATNSTGDPFADALLGNFNTYTQVSADPVGHFRYNNTEAYVDDSWKATRKLSLEIGLRYQYIPATYTQGNNIVNFVPNLYGPGLTLVADKNGNFNLPAPGSPFLNQGFVINGLIRPANVPADQLVRVPGGDSAFVLAVPTGGPRGLYGGKNLFAPRFGFSFSPFNDDKTVIRGGFGIFYDKPEGNIIFGQPGIVPFLQSESFTNSNLSNITAGSTAIPISTISAVDSHFRNAYSMQYSFGVQHELPYGVLMEIAYAGAQGRHEVREPNINVPSFPVINATFAANTNPKITNLGQVQDNPIRPFVGYVDLQQFRSDSNSNYNGLQVYASKRKGNLLTTVSYTWSRALSDTDVYNANTEPECAFTCQLPNGQSIPWQRYYRVRPSFDRAHIFVISYDYALPFFQAQQGFIGHTLGGWELGGITRAQTGQPLTVTATQEVGNFNYTRRADIVSGMPIYSGFTCPATSRCWFNPGAFIMANTATQTGPFNRPGDAPQGNVIGPGYYDWDISIRKRFKLPREGMDLLFQTDFFNAFNRANWGNPGISVSAGGLGVINSSQPPRQMQFGLKFAF
ncbi:MAG TPA: carboxypeptidase regulatory-like domain-containing protein [Terriglobales bacterium]|jgi:hypothetical protein|nr:carboxypeptidase regulatory-like domain-containing protein [Terriglobales bacterium]